jgi:hypothetical protein
VADNEAEEGRQQNRRIEIVLYPKSLTEPATQAGNECGQRIGKAGRFRALTLRSA